MHFGMYLITNVTADTSHTDGVEI